MAPRALRHPATSNSVQASYSRPAGLEADAAVRVHLGQLPARRSAGPAAGLLNLDDRPDYLNIRPHPAVCDAARGTAEIRTLAVLADAPVERIHQALGHACVGVGRAGPRSVADLLDVAREPDGRIAPDVGAAGDHLLDVHLVSLRVGSYP